MQSVEIAGGGYAGLVAAITFAKSGWKVRLHERDKQLRSFGAGIFLWENGLRILGRLGIEQSLLERSCTLDSFIKCDPQGGSVQAYEFGPNSGTRAVVTARQALHDLLRQSAEAHGVEVSVNDEIVGADPRGVLHASSGASYEADLVIAADGVFSKVRSSVTKDVSTTLHKQGAVRVLIPANPGEIPETGGYHARSYLSDDGRRHMLVVPCNPQQIYLCITASVPASEGEPYPLNLKAWSDAFPTLRSEFERAAQAEGRFDLFQTLRLNQWAFGRVALVGDAAHGMTPALGQGAGCAMMNAYTLAKTVNEADNIDQGLTRWQSNIKPVIDRAQDYCENITEGRLPKEEGFLSEPSLYTARFNPLEINGATSP